MWLLTWGCVWFLVPTSIISKGHGLFSLEHCWSRGAEPRIFHQTTWECRRDVSFVTTLSTLRISSSWVCYVNHSQSWCSRFCSGIFQHLGFFWSDQNLSKWWCVFFGPQQKTSHSRRRTTVLLRFRQFFGVFVVKVIDLTDLSLSIRCLNSCYSMLIYTHRIHVWYVYLPTLGWFVW